MGLIHYLYSSIDFYNNVSLIEVLEVFINYNSFE